MRLYTPAEIQNMTVDGKTRKKISEPVEGRGNGTIVFKKQSQLVESYYRYRHQNSDRMLFIGRLKATRNGPGYTLPELRDKARKLARIRRDINPLDLKEHLELEEKERVRAADIKKQQEAIEDSRGTFKDLIDFYITSLYEKGASSARGVENLIKCHIIKPFPELMTKKANMIDTNDIIVILARVGVEKKLTTTFNRLRSFLLAAFNIGMKAENDPLQIGKTGRRFCITANPVAATPAHPELERVCDRVLTNAEILHLWQFIDQGKPTWNPIYKLFVQFLFCCYGNRPEQLNHILWTDICFQQRTLQFTDTKGKGAKPKKRIIPLTERATDILRQVAKISGGFDGPFNITGRGFMQSRNLGRFIGAYNDWLAEQAKKEGREAPERFTARDIRRTATRLFTDCRVLKEHRYLLQSREDGSVESKHYDHDDRLPEKRDVAKVYDDYLSKIIDGTD